MPVTKTPRAPRRPRVESSVTPADFTAITQYLSTEVLVERDLELRLITLVALFGGNLHQLGAPGVAKSLGLREWAACIVGANAVDLEVKYFEKLLHATMPADAIIGAYDMAEFARSGEFKRNVQHYAPMAHVIFCDEIYRANGPTLDALLPLYNSKERKYEANGGMARAACRVFVSASNHMPDPDNEQAEALVDRATVISIVERVRQDDSFKEILRRDAQRELREMGEVQMARPTVTLAQLDEAQAAVKHITHGAEFLDKAAELRRKAIGEGLGVSDRRWTEICNGLCRAQAWMSGRDHTIPEDLSVAEHAMWRDPDERPTAHQLVLEFHGRFEREATKLRQEATKPLAMMDEVRPLIEGIPPTEQISPEILTKAVGASRAIALVHQRVASVLKEAEGEKRDASSLQELANELVAQAKWLKRNKLPDGGILD